jgi:hypothetical protein
VSVDRFQARWFLKLEGGSARELMPAALPICTRHFGFDYFEGCSSW